MDDLGLFASILGHVGDGNFHESIMYNRRNKEEREKVETCVKNMVKRALEMEGTCTGEHSIGWGKKESLLWEVGPDTLGVMVRLSISDEGVVWTSLTPYLESDQAGPGSEMDHVSTHPYSSESMDSSLHMSIGTPARSLTVPSEPSHEHPSRWHTFSKAQHYKGTGQPGRISMELYHGAQEHNTAVTAEQEHAVL